LKGEDHGTCTCVPALFISVEKDIFSVKVMCESQTVTGSPSIPKVRVLEESPPKVPFGRIFKKAAILSPILKSIPLTGVCVLVLAFIVVGHSAESASIFTISSRNPVPETVVPSHLLISTPAKAFKAVALSAQQREMETDPVPIVIAAEIGPERKTKYCPPEVVWVGK